MSKNFCNSGGDAVYGLGVVGALIYYLTHASSFIDGLWGIGKALFWPAFLMYKLLEMWQI
ncbi:hypothetical protein LRY65_01700 [Candidatus Woesebacteria bacterium]|nr:hypothetical protein [Candidatus Woesebacteria bacterium]MCD8507122.1 hypothetical protein [Candidatus Woesebacteria bacterium]MCD8526905.1 hypothetical protein [Candidatus Woesebacteria bacterium]MCD8546055.1 hypothetical protein [Candidatus Woesebacteria bacterium]